MEIYGMSAVAILAATAIGMALGALWYSPVLFGAAWMRCVGKTPESLGSSTAPIIGSVVASFLTAVGVALVMSLAGVHSVQGALQVAAILGLLVVFPAMFSDSLFCGWGTQLLFIQTGYRIASIVLMALALFFLT